MWPQQQQQTHNKYNNKQAQQQQHATAQGRRTEEGVSCREMRCGIDTPSQFCLNVMETIDQTNHKLYKKDV